MKTVLQDPSVENILSAPWQWQLVSTLFPPDPEPVDDARHLDWMTLREHRHEGSREEILLALRGSGLQGMDGRAYPCNPGTIFLFGAGVSHDFGYPPFAPTMRHLWVHIMGESAYALVVDVDCGGKPEIHCRVDLYEDTATLKALMHVWRGLSTPQAYPPALSKSRLLAALHLVVADIVDRGLEDRTADESFSEYVIRNVADHIASSDGRGASVADLARLAGYSTYHFVRLFKEHTGQTVHQFVDKCRLDHADKMLQEGYKRKEVAAVLGFKHPSSFTRWYAAKKKNNSA